MKKSYKIFYTILCLLLLNSCGKKSNLIFPEEKKAVNFKENIEGYNFSEETDKKDEKFKYYSQKKKYEEERKLRFLKKMKEKQQSQQNSEGENKP